MRTTRRLLLLEKLLSLFLYCICIFFFALRRALTTSLLYNDRRAFGPNSNIEQIAKMSTEVHKILKESYAGSKVPTEDRILKDGKAAFKEFITLYRQKAREGLAVIDAAGGKKKGQEKEQAEAFAYVQWFSKLWRKVRRAQWFIHSRIKMEETMCVRYQ